MVDPARHDPGFDEHRAAMFAGPRELRCTAVAWLRRPATGVRRAPLAPPEEPVAALLRGLLDGLALQGSHDPEEMPPDRLRAPSPSTSTASAPGRDNRYRTVGGGP